MQLSEANFDEYEFDGTKYFITNLTVENRNEILTAMELKKIVDYIGESHSIVCDVHCCGLWHQVKVKQLLVESNKK